MLIYLDANIVQYCADYGDLVFRRAGARRPSSQKLEIELRALAEVAAEVPRDAWVHAFTLGAYGMLKIGLMTRVALRHTGRPLKASAAMQAAFLMVFAASLLRLAYSVHGLGEWALSGSALLWAGALLTYLALHGPMLLRQSLPRQ
mgnify:CR=1 FL=1